MTTKPNNPSPAEVLADLLAMRSSMSEALRDVLAIQELSKAQAEHVQTVVCEAERTLASLAEVQRCLDELSQCDGREGRNLAAYIRLNYPRLWAKAFAGVYAESLNLGSIIGMTLHFADDLCGLKDAIFGVVDRDRSRVDVKSRAIKEPVVEDLPPIPVDGSLVYFLKRDQAVKIGHSRRLEDRIKELQTGSYRRLTLMATEPGGGARERELHRLFASDRMTGEWFRLTPTIRAYIDGVRGGTHQEVPQ